MRIDVLNRYNFCCLMEDNKLNDSNIEERSDVFIISICGPISNNHYFKNDHNNVLNVEFDDVITQISNDYYAITEYEAKKMYDFIKLNLHRKQFIVHCEAGLSRSAAIGKFVDDVFGSEDYEYRHQHTYPNVLVYSYLMRLYNKEHNIE